MDFDIIMVGVDMSVNLFFFGGVKERLGFFFGVGEVDEELVVDKIEYVGEDIFNDEDLFLIVYVSKVFYLYDLFVIG